MTWMDALQSGVARSREKKSTVAFFREQEACRALKNVHGRLAGDAAHRRGPHRSTQSFSPCRHAVEIRQAQVPEHVLVRNAFAAALAQPLSRPLGCSPFFFGLWLIVEGAVASLRATGSINASNSPTTAENWFVSVLLFVHRRSVRSFTSPCLR
jgi:hypothetical protein